MKTVFVDSNVFLRFFRRDEPLQTQAVGGPSTNGGRGHDQLVTGPPVMFEVAWTLRTTYRVPNEEILAALEALTATPGLYIIDIDLVTAAIALARSTGQAFADAYIAASSHAIGADEIATFNRKHFERLGAAMHSFRG